MTPVANRDPGRHADRHHHQGETQRRPDDPQAALLDRLSEDAVLDALGPDWSRMSAKEQVAYGPAVQPIASTVQTLSMAIDIETAALFDRIDARLYRLGLGLDQHPAQRTAPPPTEIMRKYQEARTRIAAERTAS